MKTHRLLPLLLLALAPHLARAAAILVQSSGKQVAAFVSTNPTYTLTGVTNHDTIIVLVNYLDSSSNSNIPTGVADAGGAFTADEQINADNSPGRHNSASVYSFFNAAAGSHAITLTRGAGATGVYWVYEVLEVSGLPTTNSKDAASTTNFGASTGPVNVGGSTLSAANGFAVVLNVNQNANNPPALYPPQIGMSGSGSSYIGLFTGSADFPSGSAGYLIPSTTATLGADFGTIGTATAWGVASVYYAPAAPPPASSPAQFFLGASLLPPSVKLGMLP